MLPSTDQKYFQTGLFRLLGGKTTLSAAELGSELSAILFFLSAICICHSFCHVSLSAVNEACKCDSCDLSLTRHVVRPLAKQPLMCFFAVDSRFSFKYSNIYSNLHTSHSSIHPPEESFQQCWRKVLCTGFYVRF